MVQNLWDLYQIPRREAQPSIIYLYANLRSKKFDPRLPISFVLIRMKLLAVWFCMNNYDKYHTVQLHTMTVL